jgi:hypothetical protein
MGRVCEKVIINGGRLVATARAAGLKVTRMAKVSERFAALRFTRQRHGGDPVWQRS